MTPLMHPQFDPVAISIGPLSIHWYGLMYLAAFVLFVALGRVHARRLPQQGWSNQAIDDLLQRLDRLFAAIADLRTGRLQARVRVGAGPGSPAASSDGTRLFVADSPADRARQIKRAREGGGPALLECKMVRMYGHFEGDQQTYRAKGELDDIRAQWIYRDIDRAFTVPDTTLVWRYCTDSAPYVFQGLTFIPEAITRSEVTRTIGELSSDVTVEAGDTNPFALQMLAGLSARPVDVLIQRVQRGATSADTVFTGKATSVSLDGPKAAINCVPRGAVASKRKIPWLTYQSGCNWQLFSAGCTLNRDSSLLGPYTLAASAFVGSVMTITGDHENGDLSNGYVERVADGDRRFIEQNVGEVLTLQGSFQNIVDGEQWKVYPGCRRTEADCTGRYNNLVHFLGDLGARCVDA